MGKPGKWSPVKIGISMAIFEPNLDYLHDQLSSLEKQTHSEWFCLITSDSDLSRIMNDKRFHRYFSDYRFKWIENNIRLGAKKNFEFGVRNLLEEEVDAIAFSDQDDIWRQDKLEVLIKELGRAGKMSVVHSDLEVISHGRSIGSAWKIENRAPNIKDFRSLIMCNSVTGCSMIMDVELARKYPIIPDSFDFHDHWFAVMASLHGGVYPIEKTLMEYRIHDGNVVGIESFEGVLKMKKSAKMDGLVSRTREGAMKRCNMENDALNEAGIAGSRLLETKTKTKAFCSGLRSLWGFSTNLAKRNGALARAYLGHSIGSFLIAFFGLERNNRLTSGQHGRDT